MARVAVDQVEVERLERLIGPTGGLRPTRMVEAYLKKAAEKPIAKGTTR